MKKKQSILNSSLPNRPNIRAPKEEFSLETEIYTYKQKRGSTPHPFSRRAFTLVELLVVIAILGILMTLLFPAIESSMERARAAGCQSNLRAIGTGLILYAADHDGKLVDRSSLGGGRFWFHELEHYLGGPVDDHRSRDRPAWQLCPSKRIPITRHDMIGYGWNFRYFGYTATALTSGRSTRLSAVPEPGQTVIIGDSTDDTPEDQPYRHPYIYAFLPWTIARRHNDGQHSLFVDMTVRWIQADDLEAQLPQLYQQHKDPTAQP